MTINSTGDVAGRGARPWVLVGVLVVIYMGAFVDRVVLSLLVDPIRTDLGIGDVEISLLLGVAFSLFYIVFSIPAGVLIDRGRRRGIIAVSAVAWSLMTIVCGLAASYAQLFIGRIGVGLAEAFITPAAFSLIRDDVPLAQRGRAFSILAMAPYAGSAIALAGGGALIAFAGRGGFGGWPLIGTLRHWQAVLVTVGVLGLPLALPLLLLPRDRNGVAPGLEGGGARFGEGLRYMRAHAGPYAALAAYGTAGAMLAFGVGAWVPTVMHRSFAIPLAAVGLVSGPIILIAAIAGLTVCGWALDRLNARGRDPLAYGIPALALSAAAAVAIALMPTERLAWLAFGVTTFFGGATYSVGATTLSRLTPAPLMGKVSALYLLSQALIGGGLGPTLVAWMAAPFAGPRAIGYALSLYCALAGAIALTAAVTLSRMTAGRSADAA